MNRSKESAFIKRILLKTIATLGLLSLIVAPFANDAEGRQSGGRYTIIIDPAHGGVDKGVAVSKDIYEKDTVLVLVKMIQKYLAGAGAVKVELTRSEDRSMSFTERQRKADAARADLFVSLHVNAGFGRNASGFEVYFPGFGVSTGKGNDGREIVKDMVRTQSLNESVRFARIIQKHFEKIFPRKDRGLREAPHRILRGLNVAAVVLETGFATDKTSGKELLDESRQKEIAEAIAKSIKEFFANEK